MMVRRSSAVSFAFCWATSSFFFKEFTSFFA
jgi:hypothetical protein